MKARSFDLIRFAAVALLAPSALAQPTEVPDDSPTEIIQGDTNRERMLTVPVRLGENGPFPFLIDTGSQRSVVSTQLATRLGIAPKGQKRVIGIAGAEMIDWAEAEEITLGSRTLFGQFILLMDEEGLGADGILGIDALQGQRVLLDFAASTLAIGDARSLGGNRGYEIVVTARRRQGQLIMTNAMLDGVRTAVVIDTGANSSIGNRALQQALRQNRNLPPTWLISVTGKRIGADLGTANRLDIGTIGITNLVIAFADAPPFAALGLDRRPALLLGMRELRLFRRVAIDFPARKVMFDIPDDL